MRQPMRQLCLAIVTIALSSTTLSAQHHGHGHQHGSWGGGWGGAGRSWGFGGRGAYGFARMGGFLPYGYGFGYSSFGGFGGLNYYNGPVGVPYFGVGPYYGYGFAQAPIAPTYYGPLAPVVVQTEPIYIGRNPADNPAIQEWMPRFNGQNGFKGQNAGANANGNAVLAGAQPRQADVRVFVKPTTPESKRKSIRYQAQGDEWFAKQNYLQAFARYKQAYSAAPDRPEPRFRMAICLAAMAEYGSAVDELKRLARLDPEWPIHGDRLDDLFGAEHNLSKNAVLFKVADWVKEDVRDPERLYLMGVLLHFNEDRDKAKVIFQTASLLTGEADYVSVYLTPAAGAQPAPPRAGRALPAHPNEEEDEAPVPMPQAQPAAPKLVPPQPGREVAGPRLPVLREPVGAEPDAR